MRKLLTAAIPFLLLACNGSGGGPAAASLQIAPGVRLDLFRAGGVISEIAAVSVPYREPRAVQRLVNVVADFNGDGAIADYSAGGPTQEEWLVRNVPVLVSETDLSSFFRLVDVAVAALATVRVRVVLSDVELAAAPPLGPPSMDSFETDVAVLVTDREQLATPGPGFVGGGGGAGSQNNWLNETAGTDLDLGSVFYRPGLPDVPQSANTCVLHAIAGSLSWLARTYGFEGKLNDTDLGIDVSTLEGVNELAFQVDDLGQMNYNPQVGVLNTVLFDGKNRYVEAKKLPIETRRATTNLFAEIKQALQDGCTVELVMSFGGGGGHMVSLAGFSDIQLPSGGRSQTLTFHDSDTTTFNDTYPVQPGAAGGQDKIGKFPFQGQLQEATLREIVIQCFKPLLIPGEECVVDGHVSVPCLVLDGRHYPLYQFRRADNPQDACGAPHWHADRPVFPLDPPSGQTGQKTDPLPNECGFGKEAEVPQAMFRIPFSAWQTFLMNVPPPP